MLLAERCNLSQLKSFIIKGLFGFQDIEIPLEKEAVILIAENGSGKTTILNTLYYSLSCKFDKLVTVDFESVVLEFASGVSVKINKSDLEPLYNRDAFIEQLIRENHTSETIREIDSDTKVGEIKTNQKKKVYEIIETIQKNLNESILYFPTYRRIEEDLKNLGYEDILDRLSLAEGEGEGQLIQFGMNYVIGKFNEIKTDIKNSALDLFSKVTGKMLTQLVSDINITQKMRDRIQPDTLNIVLNRVGEKNISKFDRERIDKLILSGEINEPRYNQLVYFLSQLVELYEQQKEKDSSIKNFAQICNKYLNGKRIVYDEARVELSIIETRNNKQTDINNFSSGEKQIISLFSKIYLESAKDFILIFDEPELSLSLEWQRLLLPDILKSGKCKLLLAATHSPFIFDNELDNNAYDLDSFIGEE